MSSAALVMLCAVPAHAELRLDLPQDAVFPPRYFAQEPVIIEDGDAEDTSGAGAGGGIDIFEYLDITALTGLTVSDLGRRFTHIRIGGHYSWEDIGGIDAITIFGNANITDVVFEANLELDFMVQNQKDLCQIVRNLINDPGNSTDSFTLFEDANLTEARCEEIEGLANEVDYKVEFDDTGVEEAYVSIDVNDQLSFTAGQYRQTWGQFAFISPVNLLLPINTESQIGFSKVDSRVTQPMLIANFYPTERLQVQLALVTETRVDPSAEEYFTSSFRDRFADNEDYAYQPGYDSTASAREVYASHSQQALRFVYSPNWGVVGLTLWQGPPPFEIAQFGQLPPCITAQAYACDNLSPQATAVRIAPNVPRGTAIAIEVAYPINNWTLIAEYVNIDAESELMWEAAITRSSDTCPVNRPDTMPCERNKSRSRELLQIFARDNGSRSIYDTTHNLLAVGADGSSANGKWVYNLALFLYFQTPSDPIVDLVRPYGDVADFNLDVLVDEITPFPSVHVSRSGTFLGKPSNFGFLIGNFLTFGGVLSYYNVDATENLTLQFGLESIMRVSEESTAEDALANYDFASGGGEGFSLAVQLKF